MFGWGVSTRQAQHHSVPGDARRVGSLVSASIELGIELGVLPESWKNICQLMLDLTQPGWCFSCRPLTDRAKQHILPMIKAAGWISAGDNHQLTFLFEPFFFRNFFDEHQSLCGDVWVQPQSRPAHDSCCVPVWSGIRLGLIPELLPHGNLAARRKAQALGSAAVRRIMCISIYIYV